MRPKRKAIPKVVKDMVILAQRHLCAGCGELFADDDKIEYDHRPAIISRPVNAAGDDYDPPQNSPRHIEALHKACHLKRTVGRLPGAEKTVTTKGSDAWLAAKFRKLEGRNKPKKKAKIASRPFQKRVEP